MKLSNIAYPDMNVARSINLERDKKDINTVKDYQITAKTRDVLGRFADALHGERVNAWSLTGPYGMGKSAFINFLMALTGPASEIQTKVAWEKISDSDSDLYHKLSGGISRIAGKEGLFQIFVTASYEPVNNSLARGLQNALSTAKLPGSSKLQRELQQLQEQYIIETPKLINIFKTVQNMVDKPLLVVVDEFGKNLDYMSHHHNKGDIYIMQQLAEMSSVYLWVCLHQAFDEYASGLSSMQRREWSKVQGRFEDIPFLESTHQMMYLIKKTIKQNESGKYQGRIMEWAKKIYAFIQNSSLAEYQELDEQIIAGFYPLHPVTTAALIELCRRFAQNDRTLLSFLCSGDKYALPAFLDNNEIDAVEMLPAVGLEQLYDYFFNISTTVFANRAESQRWIEIHGKLEDTRHLGPVDQSILKTIGVLNILSGTPGFKASMENISFVLEFSNGINRQTIYRTINNLINKGILHYREYAGEFRLWEGSDFEVNEAIRVKKAELAISALDAILEEYLPLAPMIASRHAYKTGTVRRFERRWLNVDSLNDEIKPHKGYDGLIVYCYGLVSEIGSAPRSCSDGRPLLVAYGPFETTLKELALDVAAARRVLVDSRELVHDAVARREVKYRIKVAEQRFRDSLARMYTPGSDNLLWYKNGELMPKPIASSKQLSTELSNLCDTAFKHCPRIGNEMINYNILSSAAARARRELVEAMATNAAEERLGLKGNGPEVAIYKSLLRAEGLHIKDEKTGYWRFSLEGKDPNLKYLWDKIDECVDSEGDAGVSIDHILSVLQEPPFGMRQGPAPIYICLYLLAKSNEIAVFREGNYLPYISAAEMALMVKRPDLFTLKRFVSNNIEREVFDVYRNILNKVTIKDFPGLRNSTMLGVIGPLTKFIDGLSLYSKNTRRVSQEAQQVRLAIYNSVEPMRLLFDELPKAVMKNFELTSKKDHMWHEQFQEALRKALQELHDADLKLYNKVENAVLNIFECDDLNKLYETQQKRIKPLIDICDDAEFKSVMQALVRNYPSPAEWVKGIAGIITKKPLDSWEDQDFEVFSTKLRDYVKRIEQLEVLAYKNGSIVKEGAILFSIMLPNGKSKSETIYKKHIDDIVVQSKVDEIMALPKNKVKKIFEALVEELYKDDANG
ncbi:hypothetical protein [Desulfolucanica intricata]|uniref:hypothetical protein n=1 Tax=Desulfolucanica intricata TaxID=1285191 RepID=UPI0008315F6F|nr:hypothetical protein [Desulfolucanica intricata]